METKTNYELLKLKIVENKEKVVLACCAILIFIVGFGTGRAEHEVKKTNKNQAYYTTKSSAIKTAGEEGNVAPISSTPVPVQSTADSKVDQTNCPIKGTSSKIYHLAGGAFYDRITSPVACFSTEAEAVAAGYRKSSR